MTQESGNPNNYPESFALADDGSPPQAAEVNVGLTALADRTAWLRKYIDAERRSAISDLRAAVVDGSVSFPLAADNSNGGLIVYGVWADKNDFYAAAMTPDGLVGYVLTSKNGLVWYGHGSSAYGAGGNLVSSQSVGCIVPIGNGRAVVAGANSNSNPAHAIGSGRDIIIFRGTAPPTFSAHVDTNTSYSAGAHVGEKTYLFGGRRAMDKNNFMQTDVAALAPRIVYSTDNGQSWDTCVGGKINSGPLFDDFYEWGAAHNESIVVAVPKTPSTKYVTVDYNTSVVTQRDFPAAITAARIAFMHGRFWIVDEFVTTDGFGGRLFSSYDGISWQLVALPSYTGRPVMVTESCGYMVVVCVPYAAEEFGGWGRSLISEDGVNFEPIDIDLKFGNRMTVASTGKSYVIQYTSSNANQQGNILASRRLEQ